MAEIKYAFQGYDEKIMAKAIGRSLAISTKKSVETCKWIKGKSLKKATQMLEGVVSLKVAVPYTRFNQELAHQRATGPGGFPVTVAKEILAVLKNAEANAGSKGLNVETLKIVHICAHLASRPYHHGRQRRVKAKRTHVEVVVREAEAKSVKKASVKAAKKSTASEKKAPAKEEAKTAPAKKAETVEAKEAAKPTKEEKSEEAQETEAKSE